MAAKSDPAEHRRRRTASRQHRTPGPARRRRVRDRRRRVPGLPVDARHRTGEARGVGDVRGGPAGPLRGLRLRRRGQPAADRHGAAARRHHHVETQSRRPGHRPGAAAAPSPRSVDRLAGHSATATKTRSSRTTCGCTRSGCPPTTSPSTTRASPTPRCGRCTTTSSSNRSTTASGGTATSRSTGASPRPPRGRRPRARRCGSRTISCSWCRRCCGCCAPT